MAKESPWCAAERIFGYSRLRGREISRTTRMAEARNKALAGFTDEPLDWLVVIDADLHTSPSHIWQLIEVIRCGRRVAMACASALQNMPDILGAANGATTTATPCLIGITGLGLLEP